MITEMTPTSIRNVFYGTIDMLADLGAVFAPYINLLVNECVIIELKNIFLEYKENRRLHQIFRKKFQFHLLFALLLFDIILITKNSYNF
jgi:hypothetical protein